LVHISTDDKMAQCLFELCQYDILLNFNRNETTIILTSIIFFSVSFFDQLPNDTAMKDQNRPSSEGITLFLCGDVMTARGLDQVLPHSVDPQIYESYVKDARDYVRLAERKNGPIDQPGWISFMVIPPIIRGV